MVDTMNVEDWLGKDNQLGIDIWNKKYRYNNETFDEWVERVSGGNREVAQLILEKKFLFGGRILANRRTGKDSMTSNCFRKSTKVVTSTGLKNIEDIQIGDEVLTHMGRYRPVMNVLKRDYVGEMYHIIPKYGNEIICTDEHPFLIKGDKWVKAKDLTLADKLLSPAFTQMFNKEYVISFIPTHFNQNESLVDEGNTFRVKTEHLSTRNGKKFKTYSVRGHSVNKSCVVDPEIAYFIGRWLGDGSVTLTPKRNSGVLQLVFNQRKEESEALLCAKIGERLFGFKPNIRYTSQNIIAVRFENRHICNTFIDIFGKDCATKRIPRELMGNPYVLAGLYDSDGIVGDAGRLRIVLKNKGLIEDIKESQLMCGVAYSKIKEVHPQLKDKIFIAYELTTPSSESYKLAEFIHKCKGKAPQNENLKNTIPIKSIYSEHVQETVYNLSVEEDESYTVDGKIVHNCFVLSVDDSIESIYETAKNMALTYKAGGGVGVDISKLAPAGAKVNNPAKTSTGAVSFIELFTTTTGLIGQNGRRGALMVSIKDSHPDIEKFIDLKTDVNKATTANLSIRVSDSFMQAVEEDGIWTCYYYRPETGEDIKIPRRAKVLFDRFCKANYDYGEPGLLFWDRITQYNMLSTYEEFKFAGINPCGELPLPDGGACLLGSLNLAEFIYIGPDRLPHFDYDGFKYAVRVAIRALDEVQEEGIPYLPLKVQQECAKNWRQLGLGIMGLGDMLIKMNIRYGSEESLELCDKIGEILAIEAIHTSEDRATIWGPFPKFDPQKTSCSPFYKAHQSTDCQMMRNSQLLAIAPTGTISTMLGISGGIEPLFALEYDRTTKSLHGEDVKYKVVPKVVEDARNLGYTEGLVAAGDIPYQERIEMQAIWQRHIDGSISSTINLPSDFPEEKVADLYMLAWKKGLKGVTVFRDGCKREGILTTEKKDDVVHVSGDQWREQEHLVSINKELLKGTKTFTSVVELKAAGADEVNSEDLVGKKRKLVTGCGNLHVTAFFNKKTGQLHEVFLNKGSTGGCNNFMNGLSRMISLSARNGISIEDICDQLNSSGACPSYAVRSAKFHDTSKGACCPMAIGNALKDMQKEMNEDLDSFKKYVHPLEEVKKRATINNPCPNCGEELIFSGGCNFCQSCGYSKCQ